MRAQIEQYPLFVVLLAISGMAMIIPAVAGYLSRDLYEARVFLYTGILQMFFVAMIAIASRREGRGVSARAQLLTLVAAFTILPAVLAFPFYEALRTTTFTNAYFEMVSHFTTTGATVFDVPERLSVPLHLWRALVAWSGGLFVWITAVALLEPLNLGGFEVSSTPRAGQRSATYSQFSKTTAPSKRLVRHSIYLTPIYTGLTALMWLLQVIAGEDGFTALIHAMGLISTSGVSAVGGLTGGSGGIIVEAVLLLFMVFAFTRLTFSNDFSAQQAGTLRRDPEMRIALSVIVIVPSLLFLRHWFGAFEVNDEENWLAALHAIWGSVFTVASFLSTTGYESVHWSSAQNWSGLTAPGMILLGLALMGGGVATTAGGVKLMRVYALYQHGLREMGRLVHPSSVGGAGGMGRHIRREGTFIAWIFFMTFVLSFALVMTLLSLTGLPFEISMVLSVAALSTTGPLSELALSEPIALAALTDAAKYILCAAMVLGRLETLALIALFNPEFWRK